MKARQFRYITAYYSQLNEREVDDLKQQARDALGHLTPSNITSPEGRLAMAIIAQAGRDLLCSQRGDCWSGYATEHGKYSCWNYNKGRLYNELLSWFFTVEKNPAEPRPGSLEWCAQFSDDPPKLVKDIRKSVHRILHIGWDKKIRYHYN